MKEGLDLIGLGKLAKAIPPGAWERATQTACETFEKCLAPLTETTSGVGRFIAAKFDRLTGLEKINAAVAFERAKEKIEASGIEPIADIEPKTLALTLENAALETDKDMRELWANLIAQQFTTGGIHPSIPSILSQLTPADAQALAMFEDVPPRFTHVRSVVNQGGVPTTTTLAVLLKEESADKESVSIAVLATHGLIRKDNGGWGKTALGSVHEFRAMRKAATRQTAAKKVFCNLS